MANVIRQHVARVGETLCACEHEVKFHTDAGCRLAWCSCKEKRSAFGGNT